MFNKCLAIFCSTALLFASCQKDLQTNNMVANANSESSVSTTSDQAVDTIGHWVGSYAGSYGLTYPIIPDSHIIKNGVAKDPQIDQPFEFSNVSYVIPPQYNISGDNISFEATVQNTMDMGQYGYDVVLQLYGEKHNAEVLFVGVQAALPYTHYSVGNLRYDNLQQLVHYFHCFQTVKLEMKDSITAVYLDSVELYRFKYCADNSIGRLKKINVAFKGIGEVTKVNVLDSYLNKILFKEDFDIDGKSNVVYY